MNTNIPVKVFVQGIQAPYEFPAAFSTKTLNELLSYIREVNPAVPSTSNSPAQEVNENGEHFIKYVVIPQAQTKG